MKYKYVLSPDFLDFTATADSEALDYPAARVADWEHPGRTWRSEGTVNAENILLTLPAEKPIAGLYMETVNAGPTIYWWKQESDSWLPVVTPADNSVPDEDPRDGRRKRLITFGKFVTDLVRLEFRGVARANDAAYYELGAVVLFSAQTDLAIGPADRNRESLIFPGVSVELEGQTDEAAKGRPYLVEEWDTLAKGTGLDAWRAIRRLPPRNGVLWTYLDGQSYLHKKINVEIQDSVVLAPIRAAWRELP